MVIPPLNPRRGSSASLGLGVPDTRRVDFLVRKKIHVMILLSQTQSGMLINEIQDEYMRSFGEEISPERWGFHDWVQLLESMVGEVEVVKGKRNKQTQYVKAKALNWAETNAILQRMFGHRNPAPEVRQQDGVNRANNNQQPPPAQRVLDQRQMNDQILVDAGTDAPEDRRINSARNSPDSTSQSVDVKTAAADTGGIPSASERTGEIPMATGSSSRQIEPQAGTSSTSTTFSDDDDDDDVMIIEEITVSRKDEIEVKPSPDELEPVKVKSEPGQEDQADVEPANSSKGTTASSSGIGSSSKLQGSAEKSGTTDDQEIVDAATRIKTEEADTEDPMKLEVKQEVKTEIKGEIKDEMKGEIKDEMKEEVKSEPGEEPDPLADSDDGSSDNYQFEGNEDELLRFLDSPSPVPSPSAQKATNEITSEAERLVQTSTSENSKNQMSEQCHSETLPGETTTFDDTAVDKDSQPPVAPSVSVPTMPPNAEKAAENSANIPPTKNPANASSPGTSDGPSIKDVCSEKANDPNNPAIVGPASANTFSPEGHRSPTIPVQSTSTKSTTNLPASSAGDKSTAPAVDKVPPPSGDKAAKPAGNKATPLVGQKAAKPAGSKATKPAGDKAPPPAGNKSTPLVGNKVPSPVGHKATPPVGQHAAPPDKELHPAPSAKEASASSRVSCPNPKLGTKEIDSQKFEKILHKLKETAAKLSKETLSPTKADGITPKSPSPKIFVSPNKPTGSTRSHPSPGRSAKPKKTTQDVGKKPALNSSKRELPPHPPLENMTAGPSPASVIAPPPESPQTANRTGPRTRKQAKSSDKPSTLNKSSSSIVPPGPAITPKPAKAPRLDTAAPKRPAPSDRPGPSTDVPNKRSRPESSKNTIAEKENWFSAAKESNAFYNSCLQYKIGNGVKSSGMPYLACHGDPFYYRPDAQFEIFKMDAWRVEYRQGAPLKMRLLPFYRPGPSEIECTSFATKFRTKIDSTILKMSPDALQLFCLDAELGFEFYKMGIGENICYISSYGHFEDYFIEKFGERSTGFGYVPLECINRSDFADERNMAGFLLHFGDALVDIFDPSSKSEFEDFVQSNTVSPSAVNVFIANAMGYPGMTCRPQDLCLGHLLMAMKLLRYGGIFILKLADTLTNMNACFIRLLAICFDSIRIHKPATAMPGERFLICRGKKLASEVKPVLDFLRHCYTFIVENLFNGGTQEIKQLFTDGDIRKFFRENDDAFLKYIRDQNALIGKHEIDEYKRVDEWHRAVTGETTAQRMAQLAEDRKVLWESWNSFSQLDVLVTEIDRNFEERLAQLDEERLAQLDKDRLGQLDEEGFGQLDEEGLGQLDEEGLGQLDEEQEAHASATSQQQTTPGSPEELLKETVFKTPNDSSVILDRGEKSVVHLVKYRSKKPPGYVDQWTCVFSSGAAKRFVILGAGDTALKYIAKKKSWETVKGLHLPKFTLIYGELYSSKGSNASAVLSIIDGAMLGQEDIRMMSFADRQKKCVEFARSIDFPVNDVYRVIVMETFPLVKLPSQFRKLAANNKRYRVVNSNNEVCDSMSRTGDSRFIEFEPTEVVLLQTKCVTDLSHGAATDGDDSVDFKSIMRDRLFWEWNPRSNLLRTAEEIQEELLAQDCFGLFSYFDTNAKN